MTAASDVPDDVDHEVAAGGEEGNQASFFGISWDTVIHRLGLRSETTSIDWLGRHVTFSSGKFLRRAFRHHPSTCRFFVKWVSKSHALYN